MRLGQVLFFFIILLTSCAQRQDQLKKRAQLHLEIGVAHLNQGNYPVAFSELLKAEELDPKNPVIQNNLGLAFAIRGKNKEAHEHYDQALRQDPKYSDARANLARLEIDEKKYGEAIQNLSRVENDLTYMYPEKVLSLMGMAYFYQGNLKKAEEYLSRAINARRDSCLTADFYGRTLLDQKKLDEATGMLDLAVENCRSAKFEEPLFFSAMAYYSLGDKEKSKARVTELLHDYPRSKYAGKAKGLMNLME